MMALKLKPAIFFDRDGVLIEELEFNSDPTKIIVLQTVTEALKMFPPQYLKIIISNQSGIGRGYFTADKTDRFNETFLDILKKNGASIEKIYYCPHAPEDGCNCRKPNSGLFDIARAEFGIDFNRSWMIGDKSSDIAAGQKIGAKTILVKTGYGGREPGFIDIEPDYVIDNLIEAVEIVKNDTPT